LHSTTASLRGCMRKRWQTSRGWKQGCARPRSAGPRERRHCWHRQPGVPPRASVHIVDACAAAGNMCMIPRALCALVWSPLSMCACVVEDGMWCGVCLRVLCSMVCPQGQPSSPVCRTTYHHVPTVVADVPPSWTVVVLRCSTAAAVADFLYCCCSSLPGCCGCCGLPGLLQCIASQLLQLLLTSRMLMFLVAWILLRQSEAKV